MRVKVKKEKVTNRGDALRRKAIMKCSHSTQWSISPWMEKISKNMFRGCIEFDLTGVLDKAEPPPRIRLSMYITSLLPILLPFLAPTFRSPIYGA